MELEVSQDEDFYRIIFKDTPKDIAVETTVQPDADKTVKLAVSKDGQVTLKEISFPTEIYDLSNVRKTMENIRRRFDEEGCKPCIALSEAGQTKKTFVIPFLTLLKDLVDG